MKKVHWIILVSLLCLIIINLYVYVQHYKVTHIVCQGRTSVKNGKGLLNAYLSLSLSGNVGQSVINGELIDKEGHVLSVHRLSSFRFKQNGNALFITNYSVTELPNNTADNIILKDFIPPYLLFNGIGTRVDILPISERSYSLTGDTNMYLYCSK